MGGSLMIKEIIFNVDTGKIEKLEFSKEEADQIKKIISAAIESEKAEVNAREAARQSALDKLAALGLTSEEIQALAGN